MTADSGVGWFERAETDDPVHEGRADRPREWPALAVERGFAADESEYYRRLREATLAAARGTVAEREGADDQQLVSAVRALDDCARTANELTERVAEWAGTRDPEATVDLGYARELAGREPETPVEERVISLATRVVALDDERAQLRAYIERTAPEVAPNLAALAGPVLATRLVALAGGLESLAKQPSSTVQVTAAQRRGRSQGS